MKEILKIDLELKHFKNDGIINNYIIEKKGNKEIRFKIPELEEIEYKNGKLKKFEKLSELGELKKGSIYKIKVLITKIK